MDACRRTQRRRAFHDHLSGPAAGSAPSADLLRSSPLELASGHVLGELPEAWSGDERCSLASDLAAGPDDSPLAALEEVIRPAVERPPCIVLFSGGRDSSLVLAVAARVAQREGLASPVPLTLRFPGAPKSEETAWQELVIDELGLENWERREVLDADWIGELARPFLRRHGVLASSSAFLTRWMLSSAHGGSMLTGLSGDELLGRWRWRPLADRLAGRSRPRPKDAPRFAIAVLPARLRLPAERLRLRARPPHWMTPAARRALLAQLAGPAASEPFWWCDWIRWRAGRRDVAAASGVLRLLGEEVEARVSEPLTQPRFIDALARAGGRLGFGSRAELMTANFEGLLSGALLRRSSKANFVEAFWGESSRRFAREWDGTGVDSELVDPEALRREWLAPEPDNRSSHLLQSAWLEAGGLEP